MAFNRKRNRRITAFLGTAIGLILVFTFVLSLLNIDATINTSTGNDNVTFPTSTPPGTPQPVVLPTPDPDPQLAGLPPYVHSSGLFQTFLPAGNDWTVSESSTGGDTALARVVVQSGARMSLFHNFVVAGVEYDSLESLSTEYLTPAYFAEAWRAYQSWVETSRSVSDDEVVIDFEVVADGNTYLGRAVHVLRDGWLYVTRIVVPANNPLLMERLSGWVAEAFRPFLQAKAMPLEWAAYVDQDLGYAIKYPPGWSLVAGGRSRPVTFGTASNSPEGKIRISVEAGPMPASLDEARTWVEQLETGVVILDAVSFERAESAGYEVAYTYRDPAGDQHSGLAVLVGNGAGQVVMAILHIDDPEDNLLQPDTLSAFAQEARRAVTDGFFLVR